MIPRLEAAAPPIVQTDRLVWISSRPADRRGVQAGRRRTLRWDSLASEMFRSDLEQHTLGTPPCDSIVGVAVLKPCCVYDHTMILNTVCRKVWRYWDRVCGADGPVVQYVFEVVDVYEFTQPQPWTVVQRFSKCFGLCFHIVEHRGYQRLVAHCRADLVLREQQPVLAVRLPRALSKLVVAGKVPMLVLPDSEHMRLGFNRALLGYWRRADFSRCEMLDIAQREPFVVSMTGELANSLRLTLQQFRAPLELRLDQRRRFIRDLSTWIHRLEDHEGLLNRDMFARAGTQERMRHLIRCLVLAESLISDGLLRQVLGRVCQTLFPQEASQVLIESLREAHIFDKSELSRFQIVFGTSVPKSTGTYRSYLTNILCHFSNYSNR